MCLIISLLELLIDSSVVVLICVNLFWISPFLSNDILKNVHKYVAIFSVPLNPVQLFSYLLVPISVTSGLIFICPHAYTHKEKHTHICLCVSREKERERACEQILLKIWKLWVHHLYSHSYGLNSRLGLVLQKKFKVLWRSMKGLVQDYLDQFYTGCYKSLCHILRSLISWTTNNSRTELLPFKS